MLAAVGLFSPAYAPVAARPAVRSAVRMQIARKPGEGDPFSAEALATWDYVDETSRTPPAVTAASLSTADAGYIENDDEPWHSTCVSKAPVITKGAFDKAYVSSLPFVAPEEALQLAMSKADLKLKDIDGAIAKCVADGGRKGCPAIVAAEKIKKAADKDGNVKPGKAPGAPAQAGGWDAMKRAMAKTHDNSVA